MFANCLSKTFEARLFILVLADEIICNWPSIKDVENKKGVKSWSKFAEYVVELLTWLNGVVKILETITTVFYG